MNEPKVNPGLARYRVILIAVCLVCFFASLGASRFWDQDEGFFASTAAEMYARGDWVVPWFNGEMFGHKPPWMYWMMMLGYSLFGVGETGARFFSAVFGLATALLTYRFGSRLFNSRTGFIAGLVIPSCLMFGVVARAATPDAYLVFFTTLALYLFASNGFLKRRETTTSHPGSNVPILPGAWTTWIMIYGVMGLAALVKGPIGFLFPMAVIGLFLLIMTPVKSLPGNSTRTAKIWNRLRPFGPINFARTVWSMRPLTAIGIILLVAGPWYLLVGIQTQGAFHAEFFGVHHWQRFTTPMDNHNGPFFYYPVAILVGLFPWSIYGGPALVEWASQLRSRNQNFIGLVFLSCWVGVYVGIFSLASTKLPNYILPIYPALAVLTALFVDSALTRSNRKDYGSASVAFAGMILVGGLMLTTLPMLGVWKLDGQTLLQRAGLIDSVEMLFRRLAWIGLPLFVGGACALVCLRFHRMKTAFTFASAASIAFMLIFWIDSVPNADRFQTPQQIAARFQVMTKNQPNARLAHFGMFRPSMVFYSGGRIDQCNNVAEVLDFLSSANQESYVVTSSQGYSRLQSQHNMLEVVARNPDFPKKGELLLLRLRTIAASKSSTSLR